MIWSLCLKQNFASAEVVELSSHLAAARFNHGAVTLLAVLRKMVCTTTGRFTEIQLRMEDASRVRKAEAQAGEMQKRRKTFRKRKKDYEEKTVEAEDPTYEPGAF